MQVMTSETETMPGLGQAVNSDDEYATELHLAVKQNDVAAIRRLIEGGTKVNAPDKFRRTPLHWALVYGHQEAARALILNTNKRALDSRDSCGCTALHYAALGGRTEVGRILIERGAQVNSVDLSKRTPLHLAAQHPKPAMVEMLISRGADRSYRDFREYLACDVALEWASFSSLACLRPDSQKKDPKLKVHPVEMVDEQDVEGVEGAGSFEVAVRKGPSLDKLLESWKKAENVARRKKDAESEVAAKAFVELTRRLEEWRTAEQDARLRQRGDTRPRPRPVHCSASDPLSQVKGKTIFHAVSSPRDEPSTSGSSSLPSSSKLLSSLYPHAERSSSSSVECLNDESCSSLSWPFPPSASSSCQGDSGCPPNPHDWLDGSGQYSKKVSPKALLWCTEWEVELPHRSIGREQPSHAFDTPSTYPCDTKGKVKEALGDEEAKEVFGDEALWVQVWPKPSSSTSCSASLSSRSKTVTAM